LEASPAILELEDVVAGYGRMTILNGTRFRVARGAITTLVGANGAGKSTVLKAAFGLLAVQRGRVRFDGAETTGLAPRRLLELGVCYVPQGRNVFPELSVRHNLELGGVSAPSKRTRPLCTGRSPNAALSTVDFPAPLAPTRVVIAPRATRKRVPFRTVIRP